jgi:outer membrane lipoprotein-sorting protein
MGNENAWMKRAMLALAVIPLCASLFAAGLDNKARLMHIDALITFSEGDFSAEYTIVQEKPGEGTSVSKAAVFRRDAADTYLILMLEPPDDKGKGYFKSGDSLWFYDPADRRFTFTSAKEQFRNSNARNSDFSRSSFSKDYRISIASLEKLGKFNCTVFDLIATNNSVTFPRTKIWVTDDDLVRKMEDYSLSGQLMRTVATPTYQKIGNHFSPVGILIVDALRGKTIGGKFLNEKTQITIAMPSLAPQPDSLYSKAYLEKVSR